MSAAGGASKEDDVVTMVPAATSLPSACAASASTPVNALLSEPIGVSTSPLWPNDGSRSPGDAIAGVADATTSATAPMHVTAADAVHPLRPIERDDTPSKLPGASQ